MIKLSPLQEKEMRAEIEQRLERIELECFGPNSLYPDWKAREIMWEAEDAANRQLAEFGLEKRGAGIGKRPDTRDVNDTTVIIEVPRFTTIRKDGTLNYTTDKVVTLVKDFNITMLVSSLADDRGKIPKELFTHLKKQAELLAYRNVEEKIKRALWTRGKTDRLVLSSYKVYSSKREYSFVKRTTMIDYMKDLIDLNPCNETLMDIGVRATDFCANDFIPYQATHIRALLNQIRTSRKPKK